MNPSTISPVWRTSSGPVSLGGDDVHIWLASLDLPGDVVQERAVVLSPDEQERVSHLRFDHLKRRFIAARSTLRLLLARYLHLRAGDVRFAYQAHGKPYLVSPVSTPVLFNLAHAEDVAIFAFTRNRQIGVDIESVRPVADSDQIARRFFSPHERDALMAIATERRARAFFTCWTRKEAYIKAIGLGLAQPLDAFDVTLAPGEPARLLRVEGDPGAPGRWALFDLPVPNDYCGALAVESGGRELHLSYFAA